MVAKRRNCLLLTCVKQIHSGQQKTHCDERPRGEDHQEQRLIGFPEDAVAEQGPGTKEFTNRTEDKKRQCETEPHTDTINDCGDKAVL